MKSPHFEAAQAVVLWRWIPGAFGLFLVGFVVSAFVAQAGSIATLEQLIMSDLLSPIDNPRGYFYAVAATAGCAVLLIPVTTFLLQDRFATQPSCSAIGAWLYRIGLFASMAIAISTPFQEAYIPIHVYLACIAFMGMTAGLAVVHVSAALLPSTWRIASAIIGSLQAIAWLFLVYVLLTPNYFDGRRWLLGLCEWLLASLIGVGTIVAVQRAKAEPNQTPEPTAEDHV